MNVRVSPRFDKNLVFATEILVISRINFDFFADGHKQRNHYLGTGFNDRGFGPSLGRVAFETRIGLDDFQNHRVRQFHFQNFIAPLHHIGFHVLLEVFHLIANLSGAETTFLIGIHIHKDVLIAILIGMLHDCLLQYRLRYRFRSAEGFFNHASRLGILQLGADKGRTLTGLNVQRLNDAPYSTIEFNTDTGTEIVTGNHGFLNRFGRTFGVLIVPSQGSFVAYLTIQSWKIDRERWQNQGWGYFCAEGSTTVKLYMIWKKNWKDGSQSLYRLTIAAAMGLVLMLTLGFQNAAQALPQGNAITDPKAILRYSLPINNAEVRKLQGAIEDISQQLRANRRWSAINSDLSRADRVLTDKRDSLMASVPDPQKSQAEALLEAMKGDLALLHVDAEGKKKEPTLNHRAVLLDRITQLEELMVADFPFEVPAEYAHLPQLKGRATVEFVTPLGNITAIIDGYSAPVTGGNFIDLVNRGFYNGLPFTRAEDFYVLQTGDPEGPAEGFIDPGTKQYRAIPLEILVKGEKAPTYGITLEDAGRYLDQPVLPFNAYGALGMARPNDDANGGSSQFFFFLFEPELTPAGLNLLDGRYSIFGYVTDGQDILRQLKATDKITRVNVIKGGENLQAPRG